MSFVIEAAIIFPPQSLLVVKRREMATARPAPEPEALPSQHREALLLHVPRLLALALAFQHYDFAFEIVPLARRIHLLAEDDVGRLSDEIERCAVLGTGLMMRKARRQGLTDDLRAPSFRDKKRLE